VAFNTPTTLTKGQSYPVVLVVSLKRTVHQLETSITEAGRKGGARVKLSGQMAAALTGQGFQISPETDKVQPVGSLEPTVWRWQITAQRTGTLNLDLSLAALIQVNGEQESRSVQTFHRSWRVSVTWSSRLTSFLGTNWQWLWTAIFLPFGVFLYRRWQSRSPDEHKGSEP
jgi:hypothetical protein